MLALLVALLLLIPVETMAADEGRRRTTTTTTVPETTTTVPETTTTTVASTTTTTEESTTTTVGDGTTTTTTDESSTTTLPESEKKPSRADPDDPTGTGDPLDEGETAEEDELLDPPRIYFPVVGANSYRDTFGAPRDGGTREHKGTDIIAKRGTPVVAVAPGVVERMGISPKSGLYVVVRHTDGWRSAYVHLNNDSPGTDNGLAMGFGPGVRVGVKVEPGTVLGYVGDSGNAEETTPHLHFELHQPDELKINPYEPLRESRRVDATTLPTVDYDDVATSGTELVGHIDPGTGFNGDIAALDDHVYLGTWGNAERCPGTGVRVFDVTSPDEPAAVASFADHTEFADTATSSVWVGNLETPDFQGRIAVVGIQRCDPSQPAEDRTDFVGLAIYDLADPVEPELLSVVSSGILTGGVADLDVLVGTDQVLVAMAVPHSARDTSGVLEAVRIVDISHPANPFPLFDWGLPPPPTHPTRVPIDAEEAMANPISGVTWVESDSLAVSSESGAVFAFDVGDPTTPVQISATELLGEGLSRTELTSRTLGPGDEYVVVNEVPAGTGTADVFGRQLLLGVDGKVDNTEIASPGLPHEDDSDAPPAGFFYPGGSVAHGPNRSIVAWMSAGVRVIDLTDAGDFVDRGSFVPAPAFDPQRWWLAPNGDDGFPMVWDVAGNDGYFYASDHHSGLWVFTVAPAPPGSSGAAIPG